MTWHTELFYTIEIIIYSKVVDRNNTLLKFYFINLKCYQRRNNINILQQMI